MKKILIIILSIFLLLSLVGCQTNYKEINNLVKSGKIDEAYTLAKELYKDDDKALGIIADLMIQYSADKNKTEQVAKTVENPIIGLEIQKGWTSEIKDNYIYIKGRVKNVGNKDVNYFEVTAQFLNAGNQVLDTDYTNSGEIIKPNDMKEFEIMHKYNKDYFSVNVLISNINYK